MSEFHPFIFKNVSHVDNKRALLRVNSRDHKADKETRMVQCCRECGDRIGIYIFCTLGPWACAGGNEALPCPGTVYQLGKATHSRACEGEASLSEMG